MAYRQAEQRGAARVLGGKEAMFLNHLDGELAPTPELKAVLCASSGPSAPKIM
ncbi:MAG: hypothetical protein V3U31_05465 [Dehalococcoidia bacterium]